MKSSEQAFASHAAYSLDTPIREVVRDPVFCGKGRLLFPTRRGYASGEGTVAEGWIARAVKFWLNHR